MTIARQQRLALITHILATQSIGSQEQLITALRAEGWDTGDGNIQATLSRDLSDLGAVKVRAPGAPTIYAIPELTGTEVPPERIAEVLRRCVLSVTEERDMVVVHTTPTTAETVAAVINAEGLDGVTGAIGSGAMVLVICAIDQGLSVEETLLTTGGLA